MYIPQIEGNYAKKYFLIKMDHFLLQNFSNKKNWVIFSYSKTYIYIWHKSITFLIHFIFFPFSNSSLPLSLSHVWTFSLSTLFSHTLALKINQNRTEVFQIHWYIRKENIKWLSQILFCFTIVATEKRER